MHQVHHLAILLDTLHIDRGRNGHPAIVLSGLQWSPSYCACNGYPAIVLSGLQWSPSYCAIGFAMVTQLLCYRVCGCYQLLIYRISNGYTYQLLIYRICIIDTATLLVIKNARDNIKDIHSRESCNYNPSF